MFNWLKIRNVTHQDFQGIQDLCKRVYPFSKPWSVRQLESHQVHFPEGQLVAVDERTNRVIGMAFSLVVSWDDYSLQDRWGDFTRSGTFQNHDPRRGKTLYGAEVMVDPEFRGQGVGRKLYEARAELARRLKLKRIRAGARLRGYSKHQDRLSAQEYTTRVVRGEIFDPTLSFQLKNGFSVLGVAKNYLLDDPESLGYAAVIEWLNPDQARTEDYENQRRVSERFLSGERYTVEHLPLELRRLVRRIGRTLGEVISEAEGEAFFLKIERYRKKLKTTRVHGAAQGRILKDLLSTLETEPATVRLKIVHVFSLFLELMNVCEGAYRTWRKQQRPGVHVSRTQLPICLVLTAHPTEARNPEMLEILEGLLQVLLRSLETPSKIRAEEIRSKLRLLWKLPAFKLKRPSVEDEAEYVQSIVLAPQVLESLLDQDRGYALHLRSWVGGDKDGHPGVSAPVMRRCLEISRRHCIRRLDTFLGGVEQDLKRIRSADYLRVHEVRVQLRALSRIRAGDGLRVQRWSRELRSLLRSKNTILVQHFELIRVLRFLDRFPGLLIPLELREDSGALDQIRGMLLELKTIAKGGDILNYARGLILSHCESSRDLTNAWKLLRRCGLPRAFPVIPLFESRSALQNGPLILKEWLSLPHIVGSVRMHWRGEVEVMLGYSDSAKEVGVLASRYGIAKAMQSIERTVRGLGFKPIFFHGSGGSVARGGGDIAEQVGWWSKSAIETPKLTIQGEMVQRTFSSFEILDSFCSVLDHERRLRSRRGPRTIRDEANEKHMHRFVMRVEEAYRAWVSDTEGLERLMECSPYRYLDRLKIGSRPSKRTSTQKLSLDSLRAIPWVMAWTQTRSLLPSWWGLGRAWKETPEAERRVLCVRAREDVFFQSFLKVLGFTLAKVSWPIFELTILEHLGEEEGRKWLRPLREEWERTVRFHREVTGKDRLLWHKLWLEESIILRSPYIHLLNLGQIVAIKKGDEALLRETLVGISSGMLTTG